ncbi:MAG: metallophosphoesterase [Bryobacterales bacterium]|nr:metallophosphoesterase [Bryobacterales bacterium]MBV9400961.1 metallophosphoesterase [Bryobacterales bacterium]
MQSNTRRTPRRRSLYLLSAAAIAAVILCPFANAQTDLGRVIPAGQGLHIVAFGDYGSGSSHQHDVAAAIAKRHAQSPFNMGITMGDNFYRCGVRNVEDPLWQSRWEDLYTPLGIPFFVSLGNHDYGHPPIICPLQQASADAEVQYTMRSRSWRMPARYYTFAAGPARFFNIDTEGWSQEQLHWLAKALAASKDEPGIVWRIVYGHHPIYTSGVHLNQRRIGELRRELVPLFKEYNVNLYIAGHDHDMEHLRSDGMDFLICGAAGAELRRVRHQQKNSLFTDTVYGFLDITIDQKKIDATFYDTKLKSLENPAMSQAK